jgi:hypothetical protein
MNFGNPYDVERLVLVRAEMEGERIPAVEVSEVFERLCDIVERDFEHTVLLRAHNFMTPGVAGRVWSEHKVITVYMPPGMAEDVAMRVLCHEVGHIIAKAPPANDVAEYWRQERQAEFAGTEWAKTLGYFDLFGEGVEREAQEFLERMENFCLALADITGLAHPYTVVRLAERIRFATDAHIGRQVAETFADDPERILTDVYEAAEIIARFDRSVLRGHWLLSRLAPPASPPIGDRKRAEESLAQMLHAEPLANLLRRPHVQALRAVRPSEGDPLELHVVWDGDGGPVDDFLNLVQAVVQHAPPDWAIRGRWELTEDKLAAYTFAVEWQSPEGAPLGPNWRLTIVFEARHKRGAQDREDVVKLFAESWRHCDISPRSLGDWMRQLVYAWQHTTQDDVLGLVAEQGE